MGRPKGTRNPDYLVVRAELVAKLTRRLQEPGGPIASFRELATAAGVSVPTLQHYFGDRAGAITAVLEAAHAQGQTYLDQVQHGPLSSLRESLAWFLDFVMHGLLHGVSEIHELGLAAGFRDRTIGPAYLDHILEPTLQAVESRLARHVAAGDMIASDLRVAAAQLIAPVLIAVLHQQALGGTQCRPLHLPGFVANHLDAFLRSYEVVRTRPPRRTGLAPLSERRRSRSKPK